MGSGPHLTLGGFEPNIVHRKIRALVQTNLFAFAVLGGASRGGLDRAQQSCWVSNFRSNDLLARACVR